MSVNSTMQPGALYAPIVRYLQDRRQQRCDELREQAAEKAKETKLDFAMRIDKALTDGRATFEADKKSIHRSIMAPARRDAEVVASKQMSEAVDRILEKCRLNLRRFSETPAFAPVLESLIMEAASALGSLSELHGASPGKATLFAGTSDLSACREIIKKNKLDIDLKEDPDLWGGVELITADGKHRIRNTLATRMERRKKDLRATAITRIQEILSKEIEL